MDGKLNKMLCKYFDDGNKGYVTIGDVGTILFLISILIGVSVVIIYTIIKGIILILTHNLSQIYESDDLIGCFGIAFIIIIIAILSFVFVTTISKIKVAKCELKKKKDE